MDMDTCKTVTPRSIPCLQSPRRRKTLFRSLIDRKAAAERARLV